MTVDQAGNKRVTLKIENFIRPPNGNSFIHRRQPRNTPPAHRQSVITQHFAARNHGHDPPRPYKQVNFFRPYRIQRGNLQCGPRL